LIVDLFVVAYHHLHYRIQIDTFVFNYIQEYYDNTSPPVQRLIDKRTISLEVWFALAFVVVVVVVSIFEKSIVKHAARFVRIYLHWFM
jgi:hypothetical protein